MSSQGKLETYRMDRPAVLHRRLALAALLLGAGAWNLYAQTAPPAPPPPAPAPVEVAPAPPPAPVNPSAPPAAPVPAPVPAAPVGPPPLPAGCACVKDGRSFEPALAAAQEVVAGEVESAQLVGLELKRYTVLVSSSWKSDLTTVQVETASGPCGAKLEVGQSYVLYGRWKGDRSALLVGACGRYVAIEAAAEDLARLGKAPYEHPLTPERRTALQAGGETGPKANVCARHVQDAPAFFLPALRPIKFERQRLLDDSGAELGVFQGTWTPRRGNEGIFVELTVGNQTSCLLHLKLDARAGGQPVHLSRSEEFIPAGDHFRVRFVVTPPAGTTGDIEIKPTWELQPAGG
jgi:hypothetical protein